MVIFNSYVKLPEGNMDVFDKSCNHMKLTYQHTSPMGISTDRIQFGSDQWSLTVSTACCLTANSSNVFKRVMCWDAACDHVNESAILEFDPRVAPHVPELGNLRMSLRACWTGMKVDDTVDVENWRYNRIQCTILKGKKTKCFTAAASNCSFYMSNTQPPSFVSSHLRLNVLHDLLRQSVPFGIQASLRIHKVFGHHRGLAVWVSPSPSTHVFLSRSGWYLLSCCVTCCNPTLYVGLIQYYPILFGVCQPYLRLFTSACHVWT